VRGTFPAAPAAKFFRRLNFPVCPAPEPSKAARAHRRCTVRRGSIESSHVAETSILSALPRYRVVFRSKFCQAKSLRWRIGAGKRRARGGAARDDGYTQN
jgi:hypothetical protein